MITSAPARSAMLEILLLLYLAASLLHFTHNAEFVQVYPNLPAWITRSSVYLVWVVISSVGLIGYVLHRAGVRRVGWGVLCLYAAVGLDGLLHYTRAPVAAHTHAMNVTIGFEVVVASVLLVYLMVRRTSLTSRAQPTAG